jgi:hypothetical protein
MNFAPRDKIMTLVPTGEHDGDYTFSVTAGPPWANEFRELLVLAVSVTCYMLPVCYILAILALRLTETEEKRLGDNIIIIFSYLPAFFFNFDSPYSCGVFGVRRLIAHYPEPLPAMALTP